MREILNYFNNIFTRPRRPPPQSLGESEAAQVGGLDIDGLVPPS